MAWARSSAIDGQTLLARALERGRQVTDRLALAEGPAPLSERLVFLQVESLDWSVLGFRVRGAEVTPAINRAARTALTYAVQADKRTGSLDADFTALMGRPPSPDVPTYKIAGYPFRESVVGRLRAAGYHTSAIHGVSGSFFARRPAFEKMGFDQLVFREEFQRRGRALRGWSVPDDELLQFAGAELGRRAGRQFQLVITVTSHIPFHGFDRGRAHFFPRSRNLAENYLDVIHLVDQAIGRYLETLPPATTVVLYGDHSSRVEHSALGYRQAQWQGAELVPFLLLETGRDLSAGQRLGAAEGAVDGHLTLLDAVRWVHAGIERLAAPSREATAAAE